jgi:hypothetical protein
MGRTNFFSSNETALTLYLYFSLNQRVLAQAIAISFTIKLAEKVDTNE